MLQKVRSDLLLVASADGLVCVSDALACVRCRTMHFFFLNRNGHTLCLECSRRENEQNIGAESATS